MIRLNSLTMVIYSDLIKFRATIKNIQGIKDLFWDEGKSMYGYDRMVFTKAEFDTVPAIPAHLSSSVVIAIY